tara:strand:- start:1466 stop:1804 length:339 start_codon:yes stop_codon:yes gene_type:complete
VAFPPVPKRHLSRQAGLPYNLFSRWALVRDLYRVFAKAWIEGLALKSTARTFIALALFWACLLPTGAHANSEISYFRIGTGGIAGTYYPIGGLIAQWVSNPPGSRPCDEGGS